MVSRMVSADISLISSGFLPVASSAARDPQIMLGPQPSVMNRGWTLPPSNRREDLHRIATHEPVTRPRVSALSMAYMYFRVEPAVKGLPAVILQRVIVYLILQLFHKTIEFIGHVYHPFYRKPRSPLIVTRGSMHVRSLLETRV